MTTDPRRAAARAERKRREEARVRTQRVALVVAVALIAVTGVAFAFKPAATPVPAAALRTAAAATRTPVPVTPPHAKAPKPRASAASSPSAESTAPSEPTATVPATPTAPAIRPLKPAPKVRTIVVDKTHQRVTLYAADGTGVATFLCASGRMYPRLGTYKVYGHKKQSYSMYDDTTFFYFTMFVKSDKGNNIGFHSIPQHPNGTLVGGLGKPVSHGCVRLAKTNAKFLYTWAKVGTKVIVRK